MSRSSWNLSLALGVVTAASLAYAWQLHLELAESNAAREALKTELATLHKRTSAVTPRTATATHAAAPSSPARNEDAAAPGNGPGPGGPRGPNRAAQFAAFRDSPEVQALMALERKAALDGRYAGLFKKLNLSPADLEKFKSLLADKQATLADVLSAARTQGLNPRDNRDEIRALVANYEAESDATIQATLGSGAYAAYKQYEQTLPQRNVVGQLEQRLSYSSTPLSADQSEQLVSLLAAAAPARDNNATPGLFAAPGGGAGGFGGRGGTTIPDSVVAQSQSILSATQVAALKQLQQEQAAAAALRQQMRGPTSAPPTTPTKPSGP
jgi:hypothetical protein